MIDFDPTPPRALSRGERLFLAAWATFLAAAVLAPKVHGYLVAPEGLRFVGIVGRHQNDYWSYLAWIQQAARGEFLFRDLFTSEPHAAAFFHPLFWLAGAFSRLTGLPPIAGWYLLEIAGVVLLVLAVARFAAEFTDDERTRLLAVVLATTASGLGWIAELLWPSAHAEWTERSIDLWMSEANGFLALLSSFFTLTVALALVLFAMVQALRYFRSGRVRDAAIGGVYALALGFVHQYDAIVLFAVLGPWTAIAGRERYAGVVVVGLFVLPAAAYSALMVAVHPVFSRVGWSMPVPTLGAHLVGWGAPLALSIVGLCHPAIRRAHRNVALLACWLAVVPILLLVPFGFQRKLIWGAHVPMASLGAGLLTYWVRNLLPRRPLWVTTGALVAAAALLAGGSMSHYRDLFRWNRETRAELYLPAAYGDAFAWLAENVGGDEVILAWGDAAPMIPGHTGKTVYFGHWAQTLDYSSKLALGTRVFGDTDHAPQGLAFELRRERIRYVVVDAVGVAGDAALRARVERRLSSFALPVFANDAFAVWKVSPDGAGPR